MQSISLTELTHVTGGANKTPVCTTNNPSGRAPAAPQQSFERNHSGPSANERVMNGTNTMMSRGMSMFNDGRASMPAQW